jgi:hypothetical protein|tara:strand:+ start:399 stop:542 length:144 start_codon:yes stop_codon:yes gene_type:complete
MHGDIWIFREMGIVVKKIKNYVLLVNSEGRYRELKNLKYSNITIVKE